MRDVQHVPKIGKYADMAHGTTCVQTHTLPYMCIFRCISRSRFWGTPMPIWASADLQEIVVIGSIAELEEATGEKVRCCLDELANSMLGTCSYSGRQCTMIGEGKADPESS